MSTSALIPEEKRWQVGGREFVQRPFGLDRLMALSGIVGSLLEWGAKDAAFLETFGKLQEASKEKRENDVLAHAASLIASLMKVAPKAVIDVAVLCLDAHESEADRDFFVKNATPSQLTKILVTMFHQNDAKGIAKDFLEMGREAAALLKATK